MEFDFELDPQSPQQVDNNQQQLDEHGNPIVQPVKEKTEPSVNTDENSDTDKNKENLQNDEEIIYMDEDGNVTTKEGEILIKKDDIKKDEHGNIIIPTNDTDVNAGLVSSFTGLVAEKGFNLTDSEGKPLNIENTPEGLLSLTEHIATQIYNQNTNELFTNFPDIKDYILQRTGGKTREEILSKPTYRGLQLDVENDLQLESIIKNYYIDKVGEETANKFVAMHKANGDLIPEAKKALQLLQEKEDLDEQSILEERQKLIEKEKQDKLDYSQKVFSTIKSGKLSINDNSKITIPQNEIESFTMYLSKPVNNQETQAMIDRKTETIDMQLIFDYLRYKKFDLTKLVENLARTEQVKKLRQTVVQVDKVNKGGGFHGNSSLFSKQDVLIEV